LYNIIITLLAVFLVEVEVLHILYPRFFTYYDSEYSTS